MTNAILRGKQSVRNLYAVSTPCFGGTCRFDEGKAASGIGKRANERLGEMVQCGARSFCLLVGALTVAVAGSARAAGLGPANYVQKGLEVHFDGIDNVATGTHDPRASKWKSLTGVGGVNVTGNGSFGPSYFYTGTTEQWTDYTVPVIKTNPLTIELAITRVESGNHAGTASAFPYAFRLGTNKAGLNLSNAFSSDFRWYLNGTDPRPNVYGINTNTICGVSADWIAVYKDGTFSESCDAKEPLDTSNHWLLNTYEANGGYLVARYFGIRVYSCGLSEDEIQHNAAIDQFRFWAPRHAGDGSAANWSALTWKNSMGDGVAAPSSATNEFATVANAAVTVTTGDAVGLKGLSLEDGAKLKLDPDASVAAKILFVEGTEVARGIYTGNGGSVGTVVDWIEGSGVVRVAGSLSAGIPELSPPAPDADGWYTFGKTAEQGGGYGYRAEWIQHWIDGERVDLSRYDFPKGAKVRIVGYALLEQIPAGVFDAVDFSQAVYIVLHDGKVFADGTEFTVPPNVRVWYQPGLWKFDEGKYYLKNAGSGTITGDVECNGMFRVNGDGEHLAQQQVDGAFDGAGGTIEFGNFKNQMRVRGRFGFMGSLTSYNYASLLWVDSLDVSGRITNDVHFVNSLAYLTNPEFCSNGIFFGRDGSDQKACDELYIASLNGEAAVGTDSKGAPFRNGGVVCVWGSNTVHVGEVKGATHVVASRTEQNCTALWMGSAVCKGPGFFAVDDLTTSVGLFLSTNVNVTVGNVAGPGTACFDYTCQSDNVNRSTLDITNSCPTTAGLKATDLEMLPARVSGFKGTITLTDVANAKFQGRTYDMPIDFDAELYNTVGCIGSGTLAAAPATGTVNVTLSGTPKVGRYSLFRFDRAVDSDGQPLFRNWTVNVNGQTGKTQFVVGSGDEAKFVSVKKDATGLWLKVSDSGFALIVR